MCMNRAHIKTFSSRLVVPALFAFTASIVRAGELPPLIFRGTDGQCAQSAEICGDAIDQDCNGVDLPCSGPDKDRDGFASTEDCDDSDRRIYPGSQLACNVGDQAGWKQCQSNGVFSPCTIAPLCEAKGIGRCYYVSKMTGDDRNSGSFDSPFRSYLPLVSYYDSPPSISRTLKPGDVVYFLSGRYNETYLYNGLKRAFFLRNINGTSESPITFKVYPGSMVQFSNNEETSPMMFWGVSNLVLDGFEVSNTRATGIDFGGGSDIELKNLWVHDIDGIDNDNLSGISLNGINRAYIHHSIVHDNFDRQNSDTGGNKTQNSRNIGFFSGGNVRVSRNVIFQTPPVSSPKGGGCVLYKHSQTVPEGIFEVDWNIMYRCSFYSVGTSTYNSRIHHNLILDSDAFSIEDFGGPAILRDINIEKNTIVGGPGLLIDPTDAWAALGKLSFKKNLVIDTTPTYNQERATVVIGTYGSDSMYTTLMTTGLLDLNDNCYFNPFRAPSFSTFASTNGGALGGIYGLVGWQQLGQDSLSQTVNPDLDTTFTPRAPDCLGRGWTIP